MNARILLTGANGFVGNVLTPLLIQAGYEVFYATLDDATITDTNAATKIVTLNICDQTAVLQTINDIQPTHILHLAAVTHVPTSFQEPQLTWQTNVMGTLNLLQAIYCHRPKAFLLFVSSAEVYGDAFNPKQSTNEDNQCVPINPYAASKRAAELAVEQYFRKGLKGVIARPFNHVGPGQSPNFVTAAFAKQIALIEAGLQAPIMKVGNLETYRDFLDVRDVCSAYLKLLDLNNQKSTPSIFNIASGRPIKIDDVLQSLLQHSAIKVDIQQDPDRLRPSDIPFACGDYERIHKLTGWRPQFNVRDSLPSLLDYWRTQVKPS